MLKIAFRTLFSGECASSIFRFFNLGNSASESPRIGRCAMSSKLLVAAAALIFSVSCLAQVGPAGEKTPLNLSVGGGMDYWWGDWGGAVKRFGPSAWVTADISHGVGVNL